MENTILVPIDFSEQSMIALEQSYNLAKLSNYSITLLNVIKISSSFWGIFSDNEKKDFEIKIEQKLRATAKEAEQKSGVEVGVIMRRGKVSEEILKIADYLQAKLIIMGTSSGIHVSRKIVGSRTLHIIKSSKVPVISVKGKQHANSCKNILLPIDASKDTNQKVKHAIKMAKLFKSKITILTALYSKGQSELTIVNDTLIEIKNEIEREQIECSTDVLNTEKDKEQVARSIIEYAHKVGADLIAIMTQEERGLSDFFLGSLAQNIIFSSDIPVMTINPKK